MHRRSTAETGLANRASPEGDHGATCRRSAPADDVQPSPDTSEPGATARLMRHIADAALQTHRARRLQKRHHAQRSALAMSAALKQRCAEFLFDAPDAPPPARAPLSPAELRCFVAFVLSMLHAERQHHALLAAHAYDSAEHLLRCVRERVPGLRTKRGSSSRRATFWHLVALLRPSPLRKPPLCDATFWSFLQSEGLLDAFREKLQQDGLRDALVAVARGRFERVWAEGVARYEERGGFEGRKFGSTRQSIEADIAWFQDHI